MPYRDILQHNNLAIRPPQAKHKRRVNTVGGERWVRTDKCQGAPGLLLPKVWRQGGWLSLAVKSRTKGAQCQRERRAVNPEIKGLTKGEGDALMPWADGVCHVEPWQHESTHQMS